MAPMGQVITFYSYKGGVGRSMALANVAAICAHRGKRVIALDFDFEAPGLHRYFLSPREEGGPLRHTPTEPRQGVLNYLQRVYEELQQRFPDGTGFDAPEVQERLTSMLGELLDAGDYIYEVQIEDPNRKRTAPVPVYFIPAARFDDTYPDLVRTFDWQQFYDMYAEVFPALARELSRRYDYVLIDARTGVTDIGSICTMLLPEKLVLVFTPNEQSLRGALDAGWQAILGRKEMPERQPLQVFPLLSRLEDGEEKLKRMWIARAQEGFERLFGEAYGFVPCDLETYFNAVRVPHRGYYAYGERIAAEEQRASELGSLAQVYHQLVRCLNQSSVGAAQDLIRQSGFDANEEKARSLAGQMQSGFVRELARGTPFGPLLRMMEAAKEAAEGRYEDALRVYDEIIAEVQVSRDSHALAVALNQKADVLTKQGRYEDALATCENIIRKFSHTNNPTLAISVALAHHHFGYTLSRMGRHNEALSAYDSAAGRYARHDTLEAREGWGKALAAKAAALEATNRGDEALTIWDTITQTFAAFTELPLVRLIARALVSKATLLVRLGREKEAASIRDEVIRRFRNMTDVEIRRIVGVALLGQVAELREQPAEALATTEDAIHHLEESEDPLVHAKLAAALVIKGATLQNSGRTEDAINVYDAVVARFASSEQSKVRELVAKATYCRGLALHDLGRLEEAHTTMASIVNQWSHAAEPVLRRHAAHALSAQIQWYRKKDRDALLRACETFLQHFTNDEDTEIRPRFCQICIEYVSNLLDAGRYAEAASSATQAHERFRDAPEPSIQALMPHVLNGAGFALLCQAKQTWQGGDAAQARKLLEQASRTLAEARAREPEHPIILENAAYTAFLLGHEEEARTLLENALKLDHDNVRKGALQDTAIHTLPQDEAFRALVSALADGPPKEGNVAADPQKTPGS